MLNLKNSVSTILFAGLFLTITAFTIQSPDDIIGKWQEADGVRTIQIYKVNDHFFGKILKNKHQQNDQLTPGTVMMEDFTYEDEVWRGKVYIPSKDMTLKAKITLNEPDQMVSTATWGIFSKSKTWLRLN